MAIIITANVNDYLRANVMQQSGLTMDDMENRRQQSMNFMQSNNINSNFQEEMNTTQNSFMNDGVFLASQQLMNTTSGMISRDRFQQIEWGQTNIDSFVTMSYIASHPKLTNRINKALIDGFQDDIGHVHIASLDENPEYNRVFSGVHDNPYDSEHDIEFYEEYTQDELQSNNGNGNRGTSHTLTEVDQNGIIDMYEMLDDMTAVGIDITAGVLGER